MSHTRTGSKGPGHEYRSRRACDGFNPGKETKTIAHKIERAQDKAALQDEIKEMEDADGDDVV